jgi:hypothetical protein
LLALTSADGDDASIHLIRGMHLKKLMLFVLVTLMLEAGFAASQGSYALSDDGTGASTGIKSLTSAAYDNVSYNSSAIISREESEIAYAPAAVGVGTGYYSSGL